MGEDHGLGETQRVLVGALRGRAFLTVSVLSGGRPHFGQIELGVLENGGAHVVVVAAQLPLKVPGPWVLKGHDVLERFRQGLHKPVEGGAGVIGKLPYQCRVGPVQAPALPVGNDLHGVGGGSAALFHKFRVDGAILCAEYLKALFLLLLHHQNLGACLGGGSGSGGSGMTGT